jgi:hypothetical protein
LNAIFFLLFRPITIIKDSTPPEPSFIPKVNVKNNLFQIFAGWQFGKQSKSSKKKKSAGQQEKNDQ